LILAAKPASVEKGMTPPRVKTAADVTCKGYGFKEGERVSRVKGPMHHGPLDRQQYDAPLSPRPKVKRIFHLTLLGGFFKEKLLQRRNSTKKKIFCFYHLPWANPYLLILAAKPASVGTGMTPPRVKTAADVTCKGYGFKEGERVSRVKGPMHHGPLDR